jgi:hypothetical protein
MVKTDGGVRCMSVELITKQAKQAFYQIFSGLPKHHGTVLSDICDEILSKIGRGAEAADFQAPVKKVETTILKNTANLSKNDKDVLKRSLVAKLALNLPTIVEKMDLPTSIIELYPDSFTRLADHLKNNRDDPYDLTDDFFIKDIRFVLGLSIPCGAQIVDLISKVRLRSVLLSLFRSRNISAIIRYARVKGYGPWFRSHNESRYLTDFNELGWHNCYLRIAELLERRQNIRGMVGTTWFYDPQLIEISPRLAYLQQRPLEHGAFSLRHGTGIFDIKNATMKSKTRLRLYQEGKYTPICYTLLWPRKDLISWAKPLLSQR